MRVAPPTGPVSAAGIDRSALTAAWIATLREIDAQSWDSLMAGKSFFLSRDWLIGAEGELTPRPHYLVLTAPGRPRFWAAMPSQLVTEANFLFYDMPRLLADPAETADVAARLDPTDTERLDRIAAELRAGDRGGAPSLIVAASGMHGGLGLHKDLTAEQRDAAAQAAVAELSREADRVGAEVDGLCYLPVGDSPEAVQALCAAGYLPGVLAGECVLPVAWPDFDGYLASLSSHRRISVRRERRAFRESGFTVTIHHADGLTDDLATMQGELRRRYGHATSVEAIERSYQRMRELLGPYIRVAVARDSSGRAVGFVLFFAAGGGYYVKSAGFRYAELGGSYSYFNVVYYALIDAATQDGVRLVHYGTGSYDAKVARGCHVRPLAGYLRFSGPRAGLLRSAYEARTKSYRRLLAATRRPKMTT